MLVALKRLITDLGEALPTATLNHLGTIAVARGGTGTPDDVAICLRDGSHDPQWVQFVHPGEDVTLKNVTVADLEVTGDLEAGDIDATDIVTETLVAGAINTPIIDVGTASTTETNNTDTYASYLTRNLLLGDGEWTVVALGVITMRSDDANNQVAASVSINSDQGGNYIIPNGVTSLVTTTATHSLAGVTSTATITLDFRRSGGAGTVTVESGSLVTIATRTQ